MYKKTGEGLDLTSAMDRFDLEGAGARVEVPWVHGPRMARGRGEPLPPWQASAYPTVRGPANAAKLMRATVDRATPASPIAAEPVRGDPSFARAVAKAMANGLGARERLGVEVGRRRRRGQPRDLAASLADGASFDASKGARVWA
jgi:hypothetical protein